MLGGRSVRQPVGCPRRQQSAAALGSKCNTWTKKEKASQVLELIGSHLVGKTGGKPSGLFVSSHWCPLFRGFTPTLAEYYNARFKDKTEVIFMSSDRGQEAASKQGGKSKAPKDLRR